MHHWSNSHELGISQCPENYKKLEPDNVNPDPKKFRIISTFEVERFLLARVVYPNCTNYEGEKLIVFKDLQKKHLMEMNVLDPHFFPDNNIIARFKPDDEGFRLACKFLESMAR